MLNVQHELLPLNCLERAATPALAEQQNLSCQLTGMSHHTRAAVRIREDPPPDGYKHPLQLSNSVDPMATAGAATLQGLAVGASAHDASVFSSPLSLFKLLLIVDEGAAKADCV